MQNIEWINPQYKGTEVETQDESARRVGKSLDTMRNYIRRYPLHYPKPVARRGARKMLRSVKEIDTFMEWLENRERDRTPAEVAEGEIARIKMAIDSAQGRVDSHTKSLAKAKRDLAHHKAALKRAEDQYLLFNR
jgi:hypothetical protein